MVHFPQTIFFRENYYYHSHLPISPLHCAKLKKTLRIDPGYEDVPFSGTKWPICSEQNIFGTNYCYYFYLPISPFLCVKFKKLLTADPEL